MSDIAGAQQSVFDPNVGFPGDQYGVPELFTTGQGLTAMEDLGIGTFAWGVNGTRHCVQAKGSNTQLAGFVIRSQANPFPVADINIGFSTVIPAGYSATIVRSGNFIASIFISYNAGSAINIGDAVFVNNVTGTLAVGVTIQSGYTQTDFIVIIKDQYNTNSLDQVVISNQNNFLGN